MMGGRDYLIVELNVMRLTERRQHTTRRPDDQEETGRLGLYLRWKRKVEC